MNIGTYSVDFSFSRAIILILLSGAIAVPAFAQQPTNSNIGDVSIPTLISLGIVPNPNNNPAQVSVINQVIGQAQQGMAGIQPNVPNIPGMQQYQQIANYQALLFNIKWGYIEKQNPTMFLTNNPTLKAYEQDKQLLTQGCFPKCMTPPDTAQPASRSSQGANAVVNQLRAMEATNLSGVMSPRRIDAEANDEEQTQLNAEDFNHPETLPDTSPGVSILNFPGPTDASAGPCLTVDECTQTLEANGPDCVALMSTYHPGPIASLPAECMSDAEAMSVYKPVGGSQLPAQNPSPEPVIDGSNIPSAIDFISPPSPIQDSQSTNPSPSPTAKTGDSQSDNGQSQAQPQQSASDATGLNVQQDTATPQSAGEKSSDQDQQSVKAPSSDDANPSPSDDVNLSPSSDADTPEMSGDKQGLFQDASDLLDNMKKTAAADLDAVRSFTQSAANELVNYLPDYLLGKMDPMTPKVFTGSTVSNVGNGLLDLTSGKPQNGPIGDFISSFLTRRVTTELDSASNQIPGSDTDARLEFSFTKTIFNVYNANSVVREFKNFMGIVNDAVSSDGTQPPN